jgi:tetratricopeptide (TPR) repeat protein
VTGPFEGLAERAASRRWLLGLVVVLAAATYANALGNGWAYDDVAVVRNNPVVTEGQWASALGGPYRSDPSAAPALYRPTTTLALTAQWRLFGDRPLAFHAVNVALHVVVSLLVTLLLMALLPLPAAAAGGALFAVHPVHVEAVANVVGQAELLAAAAYLGAVLLYLCARDGTPAARALRLLGTLALYALALGAKEIAVTLPAALVLVELAIPRRSRASPPADAHGRGPLGVAGRARRALADEFPLHVALGALLLAYVGARWWILGSVRGDQIAPELVGLAAGERIPMALATWPTLIRLLVLPTSLAADWGPGVLAPPTADRVVLGVLLLIGLGIAALAAWGRAAWAALAAAWLLVTILPVSNLIVPAGVLLAERTLYLPSVAVALAAGGALALLHDRAALRGPAWVAAAVVVALLLVRSSLRNPSWMNSFTVMDTLARDYPDSWRARWSRAQGLIRVGELEQASRELEAALALFPTHYGLLCDAATVHARLGRWDQARAILATAVALHGSRPIPYRLLAETNLLAGDGRAAHAAALAGIARWGTDRVLWAHVSESYVLKGDLPAAIRAREAALAADPSSARDRERLAELIDAQHARSGPGSP